MNKEIWKDIEGYEGKYQVSNYGNIKSLNYNNTGKLKLLKPKINRYGYNEIKLSKNNKTKNFLVSTLVGKAFLENKNPDKEIMHIGNNTDDNIKNLKYAYRSEILYMMYKKGNRKTGKPTNYKISFEGKQYKTLTDMAKNNGLSGKQLFHRLDKGWTLKEALKIPINRKEKILHKKLYKYNGELMSIIQLSKKYSISKKTIYDRLKRGWTIEETIEIPLLKGGSK